MAKLCVKYTLFPINDTFENVVASFVVPNWTGIANIAIAMLAYG